MTQLKITQISSTNHRPCDHKDFKGDKVETDITDNTPEAWSWIATYVAQGDRVIVERI